MNDEDGGAGARTVELPGRGSVEERGPRTVVALTGVPTGAVREVNEREVPRPRSRPYDAMRVLESGRLGAIARRLLRAESSDRSSDEAPR